MNELPLYQVNQAGVLELIPQTYRVSRLWCINSRSDKLEILTQRSLPDYLQTPASSGYNSLLPESRLKQTNHEFSRIP